MFSYTTRPKYFFFEWCKDWRFSYWYIQLCSMQIVMYSDTCIINEIFHQGPDLRATYSDQSVRPSVRPSIHLSARSLVRSIPSLPLAKSGCNFTHKYCLWVKGMQWHWTKILDLRLKSAELFKESFHIQGHMFSLGAIWLILHLQDTFGWRVCSNLVCSF